MTILITIPRDENVYRKNPKISDTRKCAVTILKFEQGGFTIELCVQKMQANGKQCRPWVYTVCPDLSVRKLRYSNTIVH